MRSEQRLIAGLGLNDLIVVVGTSVYPNVDWVEVVTLGGTSGNELTAVKIRDRLEQMVLEPEAVVKETFSMIDKHFDMKPISDFEYLKDEQQITFWQGFFVVLLSIIASIIISIIFAIGLVVYMKKSKLGRAIRATAQNARAAKILGVDTEKVYAATFGINAALCGVAGALISITFTIHPYMGLPYTIRSFMIVIVAGLGNLPGVAMSGMGLGVFEEFADYILGTEFRIGSVFLLLVLILVYRRFKLSRKREYLK